MNTQPAKTQLAAKLARAGTAGLVAGALSLGAAAPALADTANDTSNQTATSASDSGTNDGQQPGTPVANALTPVGRTVGGVLGVVGSTGKGLLHGAGSLLGRGSAAVGQTGDTLNSAAARVSDGICNYCSANHNEGAAVDDGH